MRKTVLGILFLLSQLGSVFSQSATFTTSPAATNNVLTLCAGSQVLFTSTAAGTINSINWTFQGGNPSSSNSLGPHIVTFANAGTYTISSSVNGGPTTTMQVIIQTSNPSPNLIMQLDNSCGSGFGSSTFNNVTYFTSCANQFNGDQLCLYSNTSSTNANSIHTINWGDGTSNAYTGSNIPVGDVNFQHGYNAAGTSYLTYTVQQNNNSCIKSQILLLYTGANPTATISPGGIPTLCNPGSVLYNINPGGQNTPGTTYTIAINDGGSYTYNHPPPAAVTHNFNSVSCGTTSVINGVTYPNSFQASITCSNACGSSSSAIGPINIQSAPDAIMSTTPSLSPYNNKVCQGSNVTFNDVSTPGTNINVLGNANASPPIPPYSCNNLYKRIWKLYGPSGPIYSSNANVTIAGSIGSGSLPNVNLTAPGGWTNGAQNINLTFLLPGNYKVTLYVGGLSYNPCGVDSAVTNICVTPDFQVNITSPFDSACAPATGLFQNNSTPAQCNLNNVSAWSVSTSNPNQCGQPAWAYNNNTNAQSFNASISFTGPGVYTIQLTDSLSTPVFSNTNPLGCQPKTTTTQVTIKAPPIINLNAPGAICLGSPFNPLATVNNCYSNQTPTYSWNFNPNNNIPAANLPSPTSSNSLNPGTITYPNPGTFPYTFTATNECGPTVPVTTTVTITPIPVTPTISYNGPYCKSLTSPQAVNQTGATPGLYSVTSTSGTPAPPLTGLTLNPNTGAITPSSSTAGTYIVTYTVAAAGGCAAVSDTATVTILAVPFFSDTSLSICSDLPIGFTFPSATTPVVSSWNIIDTILEPGLIAASSNFQIASNNSTTTSMLNAIENDTFTNTTNTNLTVTYRVIPLGANGCLGDTFDIIVTILPEPVILPQTASICSDVALNLNLDNLITGNGDTYTYTVSSSNQIDVPAGPDRTTASASNITDVYTNTTGSPETITYTITPTSSLGCIGDTFIYTITVNPEPVGIPGTATICSDLPITIQLDDQDVSNGMTGITYAWAATANDNVSGEGSGTGNIVQTLTNTTTGDEDVIYSIIPTSSLGCIGDTFIYTITVNPEPVLADTSIVVCSNVPIDFVFLSAIPPLNIQVGSWNIIDTIMQVGLVPANTNLQIAQDSSTTTSMLNAIENDTFTNTTNTNLTVTYRVIPLGANGCLGDTFDIIVTILPEPVVDNTNLLDECSNVLIDQDFPNSIASSVTTAWYYVNSITLNGATIPSGTSLGVSTGPIEISAPMNPSINPPGNINDSYVATGTGNGTVTYLITPMSAQGCVGTPFTMSINIIPSTIQMLNTDTLMICSGDIVDLDLLSNTPSLIPTWNAFTPNTTLQTPTFTVQTSPTIDDQLVNPETYTQEIVYSVNFEGIPTNPGSNCPGSASNVHVFVVPKPKIQAIDDQVLCPNLSISPVVVNCDVPNSIITWSTAGDDIGLPIVPANTLLNPTIIPGFTSINSQQIDQNLEITLQSSYTYTIPNTSLSKTCDSSESYIITVKPVPEMLDQNLTAVCSELNLNVPFNASNNGVPGFDPLTNQYLGTVSYDLVALNLNGLSIFGGNVGVANGLTENDLADDSYTNTENDTIAVIYDVIPVITYPIVNGTLSCEGEMFMVTAPILPEPVVANVTLTKCSDDELEVTLPNDVDGPYVATNGYSISNISNLGLLSSSGGTPIICNDTNNLVLDDDQWNNVFSTAQDIIYTIIPEAEVTGCAGNPFTVTATINPEPEVDDLTLTVCSKEALTSVNFNTSNGVLTTSYVVNALNPSPDALNSLFAGGPVLASSPISLSELDFEDDAFINTSSLLYTINYQISPFSDAGCKGEEFEMTVNINPEPVGVNSSYTYCSDFQFGIDLQQPIDNGGNGVASSFVWTLISPVNGPLTQATLPANNSAANPAYNPPPHLIGAIENLGSSQGIATYSVLPTTIAPFNCDGEPFEVEIKINPEPVVANVTLTKCSDTELEVMLPNDVDGPFVATNGYSISNISNLGLLSSSGGTPIICNDTIIWCFMMINGTMSSQQLKISFTRSFQKLK